MGLKSTGLVLLLYYVFIVVIVIILTTIIHLNFLNNEALIMFIMHVVLIFI